MSEINKLPNYGNNLDKIHPKKIEQTEEFENLDSIQDDAPHSTDIPAGLGVVGRSQVKSTGNIDDDLKFLKENPELVDIANKYFDETQKLLENQGVEDSYAKAGILSNALLQELSTNAPA